MITSDNQRKVHPSKDKWVVPIELINSLGEFDLDVYAPYNRPWNTALKHFTIIDDGLINAWNGRVFCNPPDGAATYLWLDRCAQYGDCTALVYAKTDASYFQDIIMKYASAILFIKGRVKFHRTDGSKADSAPIPSMLVAFDTENGEILENSGISGSFIWLKHFKK